MSRATRSTSAGQTLVALLVFMMVSLTLTLAATAVIIINTKSNTGYHSGDLARQNAETGIENALIQLERNSTYSGETMTLSNGTATISISGTGTLTITSVGTSGNLTRTVTATVTITNNILTLTSWSETP